MLMSIVGAAAIGVFACELFNAGRDVSVVTRGATLAAI